MKKKISISLEIPKSIKNKTKNLQKLLSRELNIKNYMLNNPVTHINIISGEIDEKKLKYVYQFKYPKNKTLEVEFLGIGIFVVGNGDNILYSRFAYNKLIKNLRNILFKKFKKLFITIDKTAEDEMWIPKSTIAMRDFKNSKVSRAINLIKKTDILKKNEKSKFLIVLDYTEKEKIVKKIKI